MVQNKQKYITQGQTTKIKETIKTKIIRIYINIAKIKHKQTQKMYTQKNIYIYRQTYTINKIYVKQKRYKKKTQK